MKKNWFFRFGRPRPVVVVALAAVVLAGAGGAVFALTRPKSEDSGLDYARTVVLEKGELTESVNVSGVVQSAKVSSVTTALTSKVVSVNVKVGDVVKKGDIICTLDDGEIRRSIQEKEKELGTAAQQLKDAVTKASDALSAAQRARDAERKTQDLKVSEAQTERDTAAAAL